MTGFDHMVLLVEDVERSLAFYTGTLGLVPERVDAWRDGKVFFPSVRVDDRTIIDLLGPARRGEGVVVQPNVDHLCLVVEGVDLVEVAASGEFEVVDGPDRRWGARGDGLSLYVKDPDGNTVELRSYEALA